MRAIRKNVRLSRCSVLLISLATIFWLLFPVAFCSSISSTSPDLSFKTLKYASDLYHWNSQIICRRHQLDIIYYWAPMVYSQLEVKWDTSLNQALYFLDGNRISAQEARKFSKPGSGFAVGSKTLVGDPRFCLQVSHSPPAFIRGEKEKTRENGIQRLQNRYRQKYHFTGEAEPDAPGTPVDCWQFTALAVTKNFIWAAVRSIPRPPELIPRFRQPNGVWSRRHFKESSAWPIQGGVLRINKDSGEFRRFTAGNGLPDSLICRPLSGESPELPHFLPLKGFAQEVVAITLDEKNGRICFTTRSNQHAWYDQQQGNWTNGK